MRVAWGWVVVGAWIAAAQTSAQSTPADSGLKTRPADATAVQNAGAQGVPQTLKLSTQLVVVNVSVTDRQGNPLRHLRPDQFRVSEQDPVRGDLIPQKVVSLDEHDAPDAGAAWALPTLPPDVYSNIPAAPMADALTVLLLDSQGTSVAVQQRLHEQTVKFAEELPPGIRVAIFRTGPDLQLIQGFTSDKAQLRQALDRPEAMPAIHIPNPRPDLEEGSAFDKLTRYLARFPGRKNVLWFAATFPTQNPFTPGNDVLFGDVSLGGEQTILPDGKKRLGVRDLVIYPIDPVAIAAPPSFSASNERGGGLGNPFAARNDQATALAQTAMDVLANETGGKAFYNSNDLAGKMVKAIATGSNYYTLAYTPTEKRREGATRHVQIEVKEPGAHAAYRHAYVARMMTPADEVADPRKVAFARGTPDATQILFRTRVAPMATQPDWSKPDDRAGELGKSLHGELDRYEIDWAVDLHGVHTTVDAKGGRHTDLVVAAVAYNDQNVAINDVSEKDQDHLTLAQYAEAMKTGLQFHQKLDLPRGTAYVRLVVEDDAGRVGSTEIALRVQPPVGALRQR